jgi:hypothetical protein
LASRLSLPAVASGDEGQKAITGPLELLRQISVSWAGEVAGSAGRDELLRRFGAKRLSSVVQSPSQHLLVWRRWKRVHEVT